MIHSEGTTITNLILVCIDHRVPGENRQPVASHWKTCMQIYHVREGYLRKIPVERRGKFLEPTLRREKFVCPRNRYLSQITLTNRTYLFNSAEYLTASKTVACKTKCK